MQLSQILYMKINHNVISFFLVRLKLVLSICVRRTSKIAINVKVLLEIAPWRSAMASKNTPIISTVTYRMYNNKRQLLLKFGFG